MIVATALACGYMELDLYDQLHNLCCSGAFPSDLTKTARDSLRRKGKNFLVRNDLLYYKDKKRNVDLRVRINF